MASTHNFRSALNGFNRDDVVKYIEFMNSKHNTEVNQLRSEIESLKSELVTRVVQAAPSQATEDALEAVNRRCAELEQECALLRQNLEVAKAQPTAHAEELETYRRAERVERLAQERANQIRTQTNEILSSVSTKVDTAANRISTIAGQVYTQLDQLQAAVSDSKKLLLDASSAISAIPTEE